MVAHPPELPPLPASPPLLSASEVSVQASFDEQYLEWVEEVRACPLVTVR